MWPFKRKRWEALGAAFIYEKLTAILNNAFAPDNLDVRDMAYRAILTDDFKRLIWSGRIADPLYVSDKFDCDDSTICFMADIKREWAKKSRGKEALAFGYIGAITPLGYHAFIWQLDPAGLIHFFEPQTNTEIDWTPGKVKYIDG